MNKWMLTLMFPYFSVANANIIILDSLIKHASHVLVARGCLQAGWDSPLPLNSNEMPSIIWNSKLG